MWSTTAVVMDRARALRELQAALHLRIDAAYAPLPGRVARAVSRRASGDVLTPVAAALLADDVARLLAQADAAAEPIIARGAAAAAVIAGQAEPDPERAWQVAAGLAALYLLRVRRALADGRRRGVDQVRRVLTGAAARQRAVVDVTIHLEQYVNPWYAPRRDARDVRRRVTRTGARVSGPAVPGRASASARSTMQYETSAAFGEVAVAQAQRTPGALIRWRLSPFHRDSDQCDEKATRDTGNGPGVYHASHVPVYPSHRNCRCILSVVTPHGGST